VGLLTIGAFARAARLTPKALRLYGELDLLPPAAVDPESGYRFYEPQQLEQAQLIAELRLWGSQTSAALLKCGLCELPVVVHWTIPVMNARPVYLPAAADPEDVDPARPRRRRQGR